MAMRAEMNPVAAGVEDPPLRCRKVLLATDFSPSCEKALVEAVWLARRHSAPLHILHVVVAAHPARGVYNHPHWDHTPWRDRAVLEAIEHDVAQHYPDTVARLVRDTSVPAGILKYAAQQDMDLIVMGTHGRGALPELLLGSVAQAVIRESPVSVLAVGYRERKRGSPGVLAAVADCGPVSLGVLRAAAALAGLRHGRLTVVHAADSDLPRSRAELGEFVAGAGLAVPAEPVVSRTPAADAILEAAQERDAGLIVVAPSRHTARRGFAPGGVTGQLLRASACPVLVHRGG